MESLGGYLPMDRWQALVLGQALPDRMRGAALFADISGFTRLADELVHDLGPQRGAEELTRHLNLIYDALIAELHGFGGSVISFSGDAVTCWFDGDNGWRATTCALAMQQAMQKFATVTTPSGRSLSLTMKVSVAAGPARRFVIGDPKLQLMDALAGALLDQLAAGEHLSRTREVLLASAVAESLGEEVHIAEWRHDAESGERFGMVGSLLRAAPRQPWPAIAPDALGDDVLRPWLLPQVYERLRSGQGEFLAELRPAMALFLRFGGIDYDGDEAAGAKLDAFFREAQHILARYEGTLLQITIGDKGSYLYGVFGVPVAHEDDAVRAASAALELQRLKHDFLAGGVQIGISQGRVRSGDCGAPLRRTYAVLGSDVNLAARLMQAAAPGQTLVSQPARQATREAFTWESLPALRVKGRDEPVEVFSLIGAKEKRPLRLQEPTYALPMVGRAEELALIREKLAQVAGGRGQIIGITAEAGMGKSRLVAETIRLAREQGLIGYGGECLSYGAHTSYLVWQPIWRAIFGIDPAWDVASQIDELRRQLQLIAPGLTSRLPLLGAVLNLPIPDNDLTATFDAQLRKSSLEALLVDCLRGAARTARLLLVLEDCHWIDSLSHDLLEEMGRAVAALPVLLVAAYRPSPMPEAPALRLSQLPHFTEVRLTDFTPQEAERLIRLKLELFAGNQAEIPTRLIQRITARAQGNPFFIEELLNYLNDRGLDPRDSRTLEELDLPTSLHRLILARIDHLTEKQKTALKVASVIGRQFRATMVWGIQPQLGDWLQVKADLEALSRLDITPLDLPEPELVYLFKHIVTQEVAYESLPYATRAALHDQIGQYIERHDGAALEQNVDLLAHHYSRSENGAKKREYLLKAAEAAQKRYANAAAVNYYQSLLPLLPKGEQGAILSRLGQVYELTGKWGEADSLYRQALALAEGMNDRRAQAECRTGIGDLLRKQGQYAQAQQWLERAQAIFSALGDEAGVAQTLHYGGTLADHQGEYDKARALYQESLAIRRRLDDKPKIAALLSNLGIVAYHKSDLLLARSLFEESLAIRREVGDRRMIANSLNNLGFVLLDQSEHAEARRLLEEAVTLQREVGDRVFTATALTTLADVVRAQGDYGRARDMYEESLLISLELGDHVAMAYLFEGIGCLEAMQGRPEQALRLVGAATSLREAIGAPLSPAEQATLDRTLEPHRGSLDEAAQASALAEGRSMPLEKAIALVLSDGAA